MEKSNKKIYILFSVFLILVSIMSVSKVMQNDTFFTIRIGNDVFEKGMTNVDNLTIHDNIKFEHLRWAFDAIVAFIYNNFGFTGIYIFVIIVSVIISQVLFNIMLKNKTNITLAFILTLVSVIFSSGAFTARAQIISYLIFIIEIYLIERLVQTNKSKYIALLAINVILVANFHGTVLPMFFILFMPYIAECIIYIAKKDFNDIRKIETKENEKIIGKIYAKGYNLKVLLLAMLICFLCGFLSPSAAGAYTYMLKNLSGTSSSMILELMPSEITSNVWLFVVILACIMPFFVSKAKINVSDFFMIFGLSAMALLAERNTIFAFLIIPICFSRILESSEKVKDILTKVNLEIENNKLCMVIIVTILVTIIASFYPARCAEEYIDKSSYPVDATNYIIENVDTDNMKLYNHLNFGSYLELSKIKVFIDSRTEIYCKEFNENDILKEWDDTRRGNINYSETFEKYGITHVLLYNKEVINQYISKDKSYNLIYSDEYFSLYEKIEN